MTEWVDEDELTITYGTLRKAMAESAEAERERIVKRLESYFGLTEFSVEVEGAGRNEEWDAGFSAALALIKGSEK